MTPARKWSRLPLVGVLAPALLLLGLLLIGYRSDTSARRAPEKTEVLRTDYTGHDPNVVAALGDDAWQPLGAPALLQGSPPLVRWVRVTLVNPEARSMSGVLADVERYADRVDFFLEEESSGLLRQGHAGLGWRHLRSGEWIPVAEKAVWGREAAFPLVVPPRGTRVVYLRYEDGLALWLEVGWWPKSLQFHAAVVRDIVAESVYFGGLLALLIYNVVLWLRVRLPHTGSYLLYLATFIVHVFMALGETGLLGLPLGSPVLEVTMTVLLATSSACLAAFARRFLELSVRLPKADRVARGVKVLMLLLAVVTLFVPVTGANALFNLVVLASALAHVTLLVIAAAAWRAGAGQARHFVVAFSFLFIGLAPLLVAWVPGIPVQLIGRIVMAGSALEMLLLSLAIADRFAVLQQEKIAAQTAAMAEAERRHAMQENYAVELEQEVRERTRELESANGDKDRMMAVLGHDLRSPLTALTLAAEQTPVHENFPSQAAQTGRQLLLLLEDVVLWTRLRTESGRAGDLAGAGIVAPAVELHRAMAAQRGVTLEAIVETGLRVRTDLVPAQTLVRNLVSNAVKSARTRVHVLAREAEGGGVRVSVRDDGPGLPADARALIGGQSAENNSVHPWGFGRGLGLRLCVEIARALGTRLEVFDVPGGGTEIGFTLPRANL
ncbi:sensor histidine kinase [Oleiharenicola lentus]|uniref:sensor histidine kinase n=1 Tax=Oleiharenicola lentus TaxID=2508720 RepID=UPI003F6698AD